MTTSLSDLLSKLPPIKEGEMAVLQLPISQAMRPEVRKGDWHDMACGFKRDEHTTWIHYQEQFFNYERGAYAPIEDGEVDALIRDFLNRTAVKVKDPKTGQWRKERLLPDMNMCAQVRTALTSLCHRNSAEQPPLWRVEPHDDLLNARECIALQNVILHAPSGQTIDATAGFFTLTALPFNYDTNAICPLFEKTLRDYWPDKPNGSPADEVLLLQEIFGYFLLPWTDLQKIFFWIGGGRNGKGVLMRVLTLLLGSHNIAKPTLGTLASNNVGMREGLIGKLAAMISESAFGRNDDRTAATGFIKAVSGQDDVEISRKFRSAWSGRLDVRFLFTGNRVPKFDDDSVAFAERCVSLKFERQFIEGTDTPPDEKLTEKLAAELPGILNWALIGYRRLAKDRKFTAPETSTELTADIKRAASGVQPFIDDWCEVDAASVPKDNRRFVTEDDLYKAYMRYCEVYRQAVMNKTDFVESVATHRPANIHKWRPNLYNDRTKRGPRCFLGLALRPDRETTRGLPADAQEQVPF